MSEPVAPGRQFGWLMDYFKFPEHELSQPILETQPNRQMDITQTQQERDLSKPVVPYAMKRQADPVQALQDVIKKAPYTKMYDPAFETLLRQKAQAEAKQASDAEAAQLENIGDPNRELYKLLMSLQKGQP